MRSAPERYVTWINGHVGFNPRGQGHSDFLTKAIVGDLRRRCDLIDRHFQQVRVELRQNVGISGRRNVARYGETKAGDEAETDLDPNIDGVVFGIGGWSPKTVAVSPVVLENKTIMTAHGKARTNRFNDARAFAAHVHNQSPATIAAFTIIVNTALKYRNPDAFARSAKQSGTNKPHDAERTVQLFTDNMRLRNEPADPVGRCEAVLILTIEYNGKTATAKLVRGVPAPAATSPFSYDGFIDRICQLYRGRFS